MSAAAEPSSDPQLRLSGRNFLRKAISFGPGQFLPAILGLISTAVFTRIFASDAYGRYALVVSVTGLLAAVLSQWLVQGTNRFLPVARQDESARTLLRVLSVLLTRLAMSSLAVGLVLAALVFSLLQSDEWLSLVVPASVLVLATAVNLPLLAVLQAQLRAGRYSIFRLVESITRFLLSLVLVLWVISSPASLVWGAALGLIVVIPFLWQSTGLPAPTRWSFGTHEDRRLAYTVMTYGLPMLGWYLSSVLLNVGDRYLIQFFRGASEVGIYSANYGLMFGSVQLISAPIGLVAHPFLMRAWGEGDERQAARWLTSIVQWFLMASALLTAFVFYLAPDLALLLLGTDFREGFLVMPLALAGMVLWQFGMYAHKPLEFNGYTRQMLWMALAAVILNLVLNALFVPEFGYIAAAWTTLVSYALYALLATIVGRRHMRWTVIRPRIAWALLLIVLGTFAAVAVRTLVSEGAMRFTAVAAGFVVLVLWGAVAVRVGWSGSSGG